MAKADLHVHSKHSNRPTEWLLRQATTPGPLAPLAVAAAKLLGLRLTGIFSASLPREVRTATGSDSLAEAASLYLRWLTGQMDQVRWLGGTPSRPTSRSRSRAPKVPSALRCRRWRDGLRSPQGSVAERTAAARGLER